MALFHLAADVERTAARQRLRDEAIPLRSGRRDVVCRAGLTDKQTGSSNDGVTRPRVSADGSLVGFTLIDAFLQQKNCPSSALESEIRGLQIQTLYPAPGRLWMSRNGRWAWLVDSEDVITATLVDLQTGARTATPPPICNFTCEPYRWVASDGSILVQQGDAVGIWKQGAFKPLSFPADYIPIALSDDASTVILQGSGVTAFSIASGTQTSVQASFGSLLDLSSDARYVLYANFFFDATGIVSLADMVTGQIVAVPLMPNEQGSAGALAGSDIAFVGTTTGRMLKFTMSTGTVEELFPATPICSITNSSRQGR